MPIVVPSPSPTEEKKKTDDTARPMEDDVSKAKSVLGKRKAMEKEDVHSQSSLSLPEESTIVPRRSKRLRESLGQSV
jgi:hypothetical protein